MCNLYRVSNLAVWLQQINKLYLLYLSWRKVINPLRYAVMMFLRVKHFMLPKMEVGRELRNGLLNVLLNIM